MQTRLSNLIASIIGVALLGIHGASSAHDSHPQEVLDLISAYQDLAMKVRPLQDRVVIRRVEEEKTNFKPDGAPIRAKVSTTSGDSETQAERRVSERLRHKDRTASDPDAYGRIKVQFAALNRKIDAELERIHEPGFAVRAEEETGIRFGDGRRGARLPSGKKEPDSSGSSANVDARAIADSRNKLAVLQREYAALERQVDSLERR